MNSQFQPAALSRYTAYLVRMWREDSQASWRASAQSVQTGEQICFASLEALFAFLQAETRGGIAAERTPPTEHSS